jgi:hypothetical protein
MLMPQITVNLYLLFIPFFIVFITSTIIMRRLAKKFITKTGRPFSIFSFEFPGSDEKLVSLILKLDKDVKGAVKLHLVIDFIFMLGVYPGIAILCFIASNASDSVIGSITLQGLGWLQIIPWLCDVIENVILLKKIKSPLPVNEILYRLLKYVVGTKFFVATLGVSSTIFSLIYIWLIGRFSVSISHMVIILTAALVIFIIIRAIIRRIKRLQKEKIEKLTGQGW